MKNDVFVFTPLTVSVGQTLPSSEHSRQRGFVCHMINMSDMHAARLRIFASQPERDLTVDVRVMDRPLQTSWKMAWRPHVLLMVCFVRDACFLDGMMAARLCGDPILNLRSVQNRKPKHPSPPSTWHTCLFLPWLYHVDFLFGQRPASVRLLGRVELSPFL